MPKVKKEKGPSDYGKQGKASKYLEKFLIYSLSLFCLKNCLLFT